MHSDKLPITGPCPIDLDAIGFDRAAKVAHCSHCAKNVTILSNMSRGEARDFLRDNKGKKLCVSYARDEKGHIRFRDESPATVELVPATRLVRREPAPVVPVGRRRARPGRAAGMVAAFGLTAAMAACTPHGDASVGHSVVITVKKTTSKPKVVEPKVIEPKVVEPKVVEPKIIEPIPEPIPLAGAAVIPEEMIEGEIEVPDPEILDRDEPCDRAPTAADPKEPKARGPGMQRL